MEHKNIAAGAENPEESIAEQVFCSLQGLYSDEHRLPWVSDIFIPGHSCHEAYERMQNAYSRLRLRLKTEREDPDAEEMIDGLLEYGKILAMEMFHCGMRWQQMQENDE